MKNLNAIKSLIVVAMALIFNACTSTPPAPNMVNFSVGESVSHDKKQQFLTITTEQAWSITLEYVAPEGVEGWCEIEPTSGEGNASLLMKFGINELPEDRVVNINVQFPGENICKAFTQRSVMSENQECDLSGWLELPTFTEDGTRYYFSKHMLPSSGYTERSFSLFYDSDIYHSLWVAYPISKLHTPGGGSREDDWGIYDPNIPRDQQLNLKYSFNGYQRGHLCPAATRFHPYTKENCKQLCVPTNISPQLAGLNGKKWAGIEKQVRGWGGGCDTLYVVTGAVFQTVGGNENISYTNKNNMNVAVPNYYYKALLQRHGTGDDSTFKAVAIWVPHKAAYGEATLDDMITIDRLEELTGLDFFHNLDDATEQKVEGEIDTRYWGL